MMQYSLNADYREVCRRLALTWVLELRYLRANQIVRIERRRMQPGWNHVETVMNGCDQIIQYVDPLSITVITNSLPKGEDLVWER